MIITNKIAHLGTVLPSATLPNLADVFRLTIPFAGGAWLDSRCPMDMLRPFTGLEELFISSPMVARRLNPIYKLF